MHAAPIHTASLWWRPRSAWPPAARVVACRPTYVSPLGWLALLGIALWPHGLWAARRVADGSDDPLGLLALAAVALLVARHAASMRLAPQPVWLGAAIGTAVVSNAALWIAPPLLAAAIAALAAFAGLAAWWPQRRPLAPLALLLLLALPIVASLQYYAGYPLRVVTAQASTWVLQALGLAAERTGTAMTVAGQLVIVDAPCSGVQLAWFGYFAAAVAAAFLGLRDAAFLRRLPLVGAIVLGGNVLRNSVLVALEARPGGLDGLLHEAIGLAALAGVFVAVIALMQRKEA